MASGADGVTLHYAGGQFSVALGDEDNFCDRCGLQLANDVPLICTDSSDGEYGGLGICRPCIERMWLDVVELQQKHMPGHDTSIVARD